MKKMSKQDFLKLFSIPMAERPAHPDKLTKATAKGHVHKHNPVWLPPKGQVTNTVKKHRSK